jgi:hypothetical protein
MITRNVTAYDAGKFGYLVPVEIPRQKRSHFPCNWNIQVRKWHRVAK